MSESRWLSSFVERFLRGLEAPQVWWSERRTARDKAETAADPIVAETHRQLLAEWADRTFGRRQVGIENPDHRPAASHQPIRVSRRPPRLPHPRNPGQIDPLQDR